VILHPAVVWRQQLPGNPPWLRIQAADARTVLARAPGGLALLRLADGSVQGSFTREQLPIPAGAASARWTGLWEISPERIIAGTTDGLAVSLAPLAGSGGVASFTAVETLYRGQGPVVAFAERELTFQPGRRAAYAVEAIGQGLQLVARTKDKDLWTQPGLRGFRDPQLWFHDDKVLVMDDRQLLVIDEADGRQLAALPLSGSRTGVPALLAKGEVMAIPTSAGIDLLRLPRQGDGEIAAFHDPALAEPIAVQLAADADRLLVARGDRGLRLLAWQGGRFERIWETAMPADGGAVATVALAGEHALIADELGTVFVLGREDGALQRRLANGSPLLCPPFELGGMVITGDRDGRVTAYAMPPLK
jgi:hypothetical protein